MTWWTAKTQTAASWKRRRRGVVAVAGVVTVVVTVLVVTARGREGTGRQLWTSTPTRLSCSAWASRAVTAGAAIAPSVATGNAVRH
jgi:hypothetical protein